MKLRTENTDDREPHDQEVEARAAQNGQLKSAVEVRQAVKTRHVRWVLGISLALGVIALGGAYVWYAALEAPKPATAAAVDHSPTG